MSEILSELRSYLMQQRETGELLLVSSSLLDRADAELERLKEKYRSGEEDAMNKHEAIAFSMDEIQEIRAGIIWSLAYSGDDSTAMTELEKRQYIMAAEIAAILRGEA